MICRELVNKKFIVHSGDHCKVCNRTLWFYIDELTVRDGSAYITCPSCGNEIKVTE